MSGGRCPGRGVVDWGVDVRGVVSYTHALLQGFSFEQIRQNIPSNLLHLWVKSLLHLWVIQNYYICG